MTSQFALPLAWPADARDDAFLVTGASRQAAQLLDHWGTWPVAAALLTGPRKSGRSLIARVFAAKSGGRIIDDAERHDEAAIFHAWNEAQASRRPLLIVADMPPPAWDIALPDLRSRLTATPHAAIQSPDDAMMRALAARLLDHRGIDARADVIEWLAQRLERSYVAIVRATDLLDQALLERRGRLSIPFARDVLASAAMIAA